VSIPDVVEEDSRARDYFFIRYITNHASLFPPPVIDVERPLAVYTVCVLLHSSDNNSSITCPVHLQLVIECQQYRNLFARNSSWIYVAIWSGESHYMDTPFSYAKVGSVLNRPARLACFIYVVTCLRRTVWQWEWSKSWTSGLFTNALQTKHSQSPSRTDNLN